MVAVAVVGRTGGGVVAGPCETVVAVTGALVESSAAIVVVGATEVDEAGPCCVVAGGRDEPEEAELVLAAVDPGWPEGAGV